MNIAPDILHSILDFLRTHRWLYAVLILFAVFLIRLILRRRKQKKEKQEMAEFHRRNEELNQALRNPRVSRQNSGKAQPLDVHWEDSGQEKKHSSAWMMELVEHAGHARRTYVFRAGERVRIGSGSDCRICLSENGAAAQHCEIFITRKKNAIRSLSEAKTTLLRGKKKTIVGREGVYLESGDHILIGATDIAFRLFQG